LRVDVIRRDRRDPAPIVDARLDQTRQDAGTEIGRSLDVHRRRKQQSRDRNRPQMVFERGRRRMGHAGSRFRPEILDDDFLDVPMRVVELAQSKKRVDALFARFADADQNARGEWYASLAGGAYTRESRARMLVE